MNFRKRRARAWAGLYVGLVGDSTRTDSISTNEASAGSSDLRSDGGTEDRAESPSNGDDGN